MFKKFTKFIVPAFALIASANMMLLYASESENFVWDSIENNYYEELPAKRSFGDSILMGSQIEPGSATKLYESKYDLHSQTGIDVFISDVQKNGLPHVLNNTDIYFATVSGGADPIAGTAVIKDNLVTQVFIGDQGKLYQLDLDANEKSIILSSNIDLSKTSAKFVLLDGLMFGIVFDDGTNQLIQPINSYKDILDTNKIYNVDELLVSIDENKELLTMLEGANDNLNPDKPDVTVG